MTKSTKPKKTRRPDVRAIFAKISRDLPSGDWEPDHLTPKLYEHFVEAGWLVQLPDGKFRPAGNKLRAFNSTDALNFLLETVPDQSLDDERPGFSDWFKPFDFFDVRKKPCPAQDWAQAKGITMMPSVNVAYSALKRLAAHCPADDNDQSPLAEFRDVIPGVKKSRVWRINLDFDYEHWSERSKRILKPTTPNSPPPCHHQSQDLSS